MGVYDEEWPRYGSACFYSCICTLSVHMAEAAVTVMELEESDVYLELLSAGADSGIKKGSSY